jgi:non-specific serine/threonine protein kinase
MTLELPLELDGLVGRHGELPELKRLLGRVHALTLVGPPGVGKSRLAMQLATEYCTDMHGEQRLVWLDFADPSSTANYQALVDGVRADSSLYLLLVLDNCSKALSVCRRLVAALLGTRPGLKLIATSRERLGTGVEFVWEVQPLSVPSPRADFDAIAASPSVVLFVMRAQQFEPRFSLTEANADAIARVCRDLDGLPLAIELAATRMAALTVHSLAERLDVAIRLAPTQPRASALAHDAFGTTLRLTTDQLTAEEQRFLWDLSVFHDSFDVQSAQAVCGGSAEPIDVLPLLTRLVACSLVRRLDNDRAPGMRYSMLNVIRRFAALELRAQGRLAAIRRRHAEWYRRHAESLPLGNGSPDSLDWLHLEEANLLAALEWAVSTADVDTALSLANVLHGCWYISGRFHVSRRWFREVLDLPGGSLSTRAVVTNWASNHALGDGDVPAALELSAKVRGAAARLNDPVLSALALDGFATVLLEQGEVHRAEAMLANEMELCIGLGLRWLQCCVLYRLGRIHLECGKLDRAQQLAEVALGQTGADPNAWIQIRILELLGRVALERGDLWTAEERLSSALRSARRVDDARGTIELLIDLAQMESARGNGRQARRFIVEALDRCEDCDEALACTRVLEAVVALRAGTRPEAALHLAGAVSMRRQELQSRRLPLEQKRYEAALQTALHQLRPSAGTAALDSGQTLGRDATLALARTLMDAIEAGGVPIPGGAASVLTSREWQIAQLLSQGLTNRAIASELYISEGTVRAHVEHILSKLQARSRVEVGARLR